MDLLGPAPGRDFSQWLFADQVRLLSHAQTVVGGASSLLTSAVVIVFLGVMFVLGLQAGLSNFVPYLGPIVAAVPIALVAMPLGASMLIWAVAIYTIIQSIEGYVIGPLIQQRAVEIPPGWTLAAIVLLGASFGVMGSRSRCRSWRLGGSRWSGSTSRITLATVEASVRQRPSQTSPGSSHERYAA
jgi:hypothetical protein